VNRLQAAGAGLLLDRALGEPPARVHPVAGYGRLMRAVEEKVWRDERATGLAFSALGLAAGVAGGYALRSTTLAVAGCTAGRALATEATTIAAALEAGDLAGARRRLPALVGRDVEHLDAKGIARATIESVAENTVDAVVAPALWGALAGAPGAVGHRALNTLDAMVGHHTVRYERFGWAAARLDDVAAWIPARVTALLVVAARPRTASAVTAAVLRDAPAHPSPNAGVAEAAFAAALGVRLGGPLSYGGREEIRPPLGAGRTPEPHDITAAVTLSRDVTLVLAAGLLVAGARDSRRRARP